MLNDLLAKNLDVIFFGTAAGNRSASMGHYYAGRGNQFWEVLHKVGLTSRKGFAVAEGRGRGGDREDLCSILAHTSLRENNPGLELAWDRAKLTTWPH